MVRHLNVPRTRAREILAPNTLELLASINHRVYTSTFFICELQYTAEVHLVDISSEPIGKQWRVYYLC